MRIAELPFVYTVSIKDRPVRISTNKEFDSFGYEHSSQHYFITFFELGKDYDILIPHPKEGDHLILRGHDKWKKIEGEKSIRIPAIIGNPELEFRPGAKARGTLTHLDDLEYRMRYVDRQHIELLFGRGLGYFA